MSSNQSKSYLISMIEEKYKYILAIIAGFILAIILLDGCDSFKTPKTGVTTKIDTVYQVKEKIISITDNKPIVKYIYRDKIKIKNDTIEIYQDSLKFWHYKLDTIYKHKYGQTRLKQNGWGYIEDINITTSLKDTVVIINKEKTITVEDKRSKIYLGPTYNTQKDIGLQADWVIRQRAILSGNVQYNDITKAPAVGVGLKFRIN